MDKKINKKFRCKKCKSQKVTLLEYSQDHPDHYDGVSEIVCDDCGARFGRWSGKELLAGECEISPYNRLFKNVSAIIRKYQKGQVKKIKRSKAAR